MDTDSGNRGAEAQKLRVMLADDSAVSRRQLRDKLAHLPFVDIVGEADKGNDALELFFYEQPDAVVASICLPEYGGFYLLRCIQRVAATCAVILTYRESTQFVKEAATLLGAAGTCPARNGSLELSQMLESVWRARHRAT